MTYNELQSAVIERLREKISAVKVEAFPDTNSYILTHASAALLVHIFKGDYQELSFTSASETVLVDVRIVTRQISGNSGANDLMEAVIAALWQFKPGGKCVVLKPKSRGYRSWDVENKTWYYGVLFSTVILATGPATTIQ